MKHLLKGVCLWLLCLMLLLPAAMAEECFTIDVDALDMSGITDITIDETMYIGTVK